MNNTTPTRVERLHYSQLVGQRITGIRWCVINGGAAAELLFTSSCATVECDPEGNGPGWLNISKIPAPLKNLRKRRLNREIAHLRAGVEHIEESIKLSVHPQDLPSLHTSLHLWQTDLDQALEELAALS